MDLFECGIYFRAALNAVYIILVPYLQESEADKVKEEGQGRNRPLSLVQEESESHLMFSAGGDRSPVSSQSKDEKGQMQSRDKKSQPTSSFKRNSLVQLGRVNGQHPTQFDEEDDGMEEDEELAPGAFKRPKSAYKLAR